MTAATGRAAAAATGGTLGLVVIGRDPGPDLPRLLHTAKQYPFSEVLYVDSGSTDGSAGVAADAGARVVALDRSLHGAAAARAAGTTACTTDWILYLDSDMVPDLTAVRHIADLLPRLRPDEAGVTGIIRDRFPDGGWRFVHTSQRSGARARWFGGAVALRRAAVLAAGNWNPLVLANEELDLYARLRARGQHVRFEDVVLVDHWTPRQDVLGKVARLVNWRGRAGMKFGAPGLALRSCLEHGAGRHVIALNPEPFLTTPLSLFAGAAAAFGAPLLGAGLLLALWTWIGTRRGWPYIAPSYLLFPQIFVGAARYGKRS